VLIVLDASQPLTADDEELLSQVELRSAIVVENKVDVSSSEFAVPGSQHKRVKTSALAGTGIEELRAEILRHIGGEAGQQAESGFLTNLRHQSLVRDSLGALDAAEAAVRTNVPHEMLLMDLYGSLRPLDEITGATTTDDILNLIFSRFCIGK